MEKLGKYQILRKIGQGGMGAVYQARDPVLGRSVAIKLMSDAESLNDELRERFFREGRAAGNLKHPNIVTIYDLSEDNGVPYIVMEYLEGKDLSQLLKGEIGYPLHYLLDIVNQVSDGLDYAHKQGIVHRDIKPGNVRVLDDSQVKIMDFGIAHLAESEMTKTGLAMGTWNYMSPEQIIGKKVNQQTDIWALGVILYEIVSKRRPYETDTLPELVFKITQTDPPSFVSLGIDVPAPIEKIVFRSLAKDLSVRYRNARELSRDLRDYLSSIASPLEKNLQKDFEQDVSKYLQLATTLLEEKKFEDAFDVARQAIILDPSSTAKGLLERIETEWGRSNREQQALAIIKVARTELSKGNYDGTMDALERANEMAPESKKVEQQANELSSKVERARNRETVADSLETVQQNMSSRNFPEAPTQLEALLRVDPENTEAQRLISSFEKTTRAPRQSRENYATTSLNDFETQTDVKARRVIRDHQRRQSDGEGRVPVQSEQAKHIEPTAENPERKVTNLGLRITELRKEAYSLKKEGRLETALSRIELILNLDPSNADALELKKLIERAFAKRGIRQVLSSRTTVVAAVIVVAAVALALIIPSLNQRMSPPIASGLVWIDIAPWAEIVSVRETGTGQSTEPEVKVTPCYLSLPSGHYEIQLINPLLPGNPYFRNFEVVPGDVVELTGSLPGFDYEQISLEF